MRTKENVAGERVQGCESMAKVSPRCLGTTQGVRGDRRSGKSDQKLTPPTMTILRSVPIDSPGRCEWKRPGVANRAYARGLVGCEGDTARATVSPSWSTPVDVRGSEGR